jgi:hypothetical protein
MTRRPLRALQGLGLEVGRRYTRTLNSCINLTTPLELVFSLKLVDAPPGLEMDSSAGAGHAFAPGPVCGAVPARLLCCTLAAIRGLNSAQGSCRRPFAEPQAPRPWALPPRPG